MKINVKKFEGNQDNIKLKVYYTKLRAHKESLAIDMATFWVNENKYDSLFQNSIKECDCN